MRYQIGKSRQPPPYMNDEMWFLPPGERYPNTTPRDPAKVYPVNTEQSPIRKRLEEIRQAPPSPETYEDPMPGFDTERFGQLYDAGNVGVTPILRALMRASKNIKRTAPPWFQQWADAEGADMNMPVRGR